MAEYEQIMRALRNAHAAGDTAAAQRLAQMAQAARGQTESAALPSDQIRAGVAQRAASMPPEQREQRREAMDAQAGAGIERARQEQFVSQNPLGARSAVALQGVPFVGEWVDEAAGVIGGDRARDRVRYAQGAMEATRPGETTALRIGGALATAPALARAVPAMVGTGPVLSQMARGAGFGAVGGAAEGFVSGAGSGNEGDRMGPAQDRAAIGGALGGAVGMALPAAAAGVQEALRRVRTSDAQTIAREFGISSDAASAVRRALQGEDFDAAQRLIERAGGRAMLADAGEASRTLLDSAVASGPRASAIGRRAVDSRAQTGGAEFTRVLDRFFGKPEGVRATQQGIRSGSQAARSSAYDRAYSSAIDYSSRAGRRLESLSGRVPSSAIQRANRLMQTEGVQSRQIMAQIADDGTVTFQRMPDVRQWDYITRALGDLAESGQTRGAMGGMTSESRAITGLQRDIRNTLRSHVPEYGRALREAADTIGQTRAVETGASLLRPGTTREAARAAVRGMSSAERAAARQGLRSHIDDMMARTTRALTDGDMDAREAIRGWRALSSRQAQENMAEILGPSRARSFAREIDRVATDFELRAAVQRNSATAIRSATQREVRDATRPGVLGTLLEGRPVEAGRRVVAALSGRTDAAQAAREAGIFEEIADALTRTRGADEARRIMRTVGQATGREPISQARAEHIARQLTSGLALGAYQSGNQALAIR